MVLHYCKKNKQRPIARSLIIMEYGKVTRVLSYNLNCRDWCSLVITFCEKHFMPVPYVFWLLLCCFMYIVATNIPIFAISTLAFVPCLAKRRSARLADENLYSPTQTSSLLQLTNLWRKFATRFHILPSIGIIRINISGCNIIKFTLTLALLKARHICPL